MRWVGKPWCFARIYTKIDYVLLNFLTFLLNYFDRSNPNRPSHAVCYSTIPFSYGSVWYKEARLKYVFENYMCFSRFSQSFAMIVIWNNACRPQELVVNQFKRCPTFYRLKVPSSKVWFGSGLFSGATFLAFGWSPGLQSCFLNSCISIKYFPVSCKIDRNCFSNQISWFCSSCFFVLAFPLKRVIFGFLRLLAASNGYYQWQVCWPCQSDKCSMHEGW